MDGEWPVTEQKPAREAIVQASDRVTSAISSGCVGRAVPSGPRTDHLHPRTLPGGKALAPFGQDFAIDFSQRGSSGLPDGPSRDPADPVAIRVCVPPWREDEG